MHSFEIKITSQISLKDVMNYLENNKDITVESIREIKAYSIGVIYGTELNNYTDTTFYVGKDNDVRKLIEPHEKTRHEKYWVKSEMLITEINSLEDAKFLLSQNFAPFNNFRNNRVIL